MLHYPKSKTKKSNKFLNPVQLCIHLIGAFWIKPLPKVWIEFRFHTNLTLRKWGHGMNNRPKRWITSNRTRHLLKDKPRSLKYSQRETASRGCHKRLDRSNCQSIGAIAPCFLNTKILTTHSLIWLNSLRWCSQLKKVHMNTNPRRICKTTLLKPMLRANLVKTHLEWPWVCLRSQKSLQRILTTCQKEGSRSEKRSILVFHRWLSPWTTPQMRISLIKPWR